MHTRDIRCLLKSTSIPNVQNNSARCSKILNEYITKNGEQIKEVLYDYGNGLCCKSEVFADKIIQTLSDGSTLEYARNHFGDILIKEGDTTRKNSNPNLWQNLISNIFKGF